jgi:hypothetical protein
VWTFPLESYLNLKDHPRLAFDSCHTGLHRGYEAIWEVDGDTLYLTEIKQARVDGAAVGLAELFPGQGGKVVASWFSGQLQLSEAVRQRTPPHRKRDRFLTFKHGRLVRSELGESYKSPFS